jgi:hypothetical protein
MDWGVNPERVASSILLTVEKPAAWRREWTGRGGDATLTGEWPAILIMTEFSLLREVSRTLERFRRGEATQSHTKAI